MEALYSNFFDYILHFDRYLPLVMEQYGHWIYAILFTIVFCETGLVVTPFCPAIHCFLPAAPWQLQQAALT